MNKLKQTQPLIQANYSHHLIYKASIGILRHTGLTDSLYDKDLISPYILNFTFNFF